MKRSTSMWTAALAAAVLLNLPAVAQESQPGTAPPQTGAPGMPASERGQDSAHDHLRMAGAAIDGVLGASLDTAAQQRINELRRQVSELERSARPAADGSYDQTNDQPRTAEWEHKVAAIDRLLTELLGAQETTGAGTGRAGTAGAVGTSGTEGLVMDQSSRNRLMDVRKHITAFAAAMNRTGAAAVADAPGTAAPRAQAGSAPVDEAAGASTPQAPDSGTDDTNETEARRHLFAARNALSELTQLPAAAQLTGETRNSVSQVIDTFNDLIAANSDWRAHYRDVEANLIALLGPGEQPTAGAAGSPQASDPGTVGTTGAAELDPQVRAKLVEFRRHLNAFERAANGEVRAANGEVDVATRRTATDPTVASGATSTGRQAVNPSGSLSADEIARGGRTGIEASGAAGGATSGTASTGGTSAASAGTEALRHLDAIESLLPQPRSGNADSTVGTSGKDAGGTALDAERVEQIRTHLDELRRILQGRQ